MIHTPPLSELRDNAVALIVKERKKQQYAPIEYKGNFYAATEKARSNLFMSGLMLGDNVELDVPWLDINEKPVMLKLSDIKAISVLLYKLDQKLYFEAAAKIQLLNAG